MITLIHNIGENHEQVYLVVIRADRNLLHPSTYHTYIVIFFTWLHISVRHQPASECREDSRGRGLAGSRDAGCWSMHYDVPIPRLDLSAVPPSPPPTYLSEAAVACFSAQLFLGRGGRDDGTQTGCVREGTEGRCTCTRRSSHPSSHPPIPPFKCPVEPRRVGVSIHPSRGF